MRRTSTIGFILSPSTWAIQSFDLEAEATFVLNTISALTFAVFLVHGNECFQKFLGID
jgi:hypothetical protein